MYIYVIQSYDSLCHTFNPYVIAFSKEEDAEKQLVIFKNSSATISYGYIKMWLNT